MASGAGPSTRLPRFFPPRPNHYNSPPCARAFIVKSEPFAPNRQFSVPPQSGGVSAFNVPPTAPFPSVPNTHHPRCCVPHSTIPTTATSVIDAANHHGHSTHSHASPRVPPPSSSQKARSHDDCAQDVGRTVSGDDADSVKSQSRLPTPQTSNRNINTTTSPGFASPPAPPSSESSEEFTDDEADEVPGLYKLIHRGTSGKNTWQCTFVKRSPNSPLQRICGTHTRGIAERIDHVNSHVGEEMWLVATKVIRPQDVIAYPRRVQTNFTCPEPDCGYLMGRGKRFKAAGVDARTRHMGLYHPEIARRRKKVVGRRKIWAKSSGDGAPARVEVEDVKEKEADDGAKTKSRSTEAAL